jgi:hypothetical protein
MGLFTKRRQKEYLNDQPIIASAFGAAFSKDLCSG